MKYTVLPLTRTNCEPTTIAVGAVAVPKTSEYTGMTDALLGAVQKLNTTGAYTEILKRWGIDSGAITDFQINGATS